MSSLPVNLVFDITYRCNLSCLICDVWKFADRGKKPELTAQQILSAIASFRREFPLRNVRFLGGEPLLRKDLPEIISQIPKGLNTEIVTNGTLITSDLAIKLMEAGLTRIRFSIDGPEEYHDQIRGKGAFSKALNGLQILNRLKLQKSSGLPHIYLCPCLSRTNRQLLPFLARLAREENARLEIIFLYDMDNQEIKTEFEGEEITIVRGSDPDGSVLSSIEKEEILEQVQHLESGFHTPTGKIKFRIRKRLNRLYLQYLQHHYHDCRRTSYDILVDPWGNLFPCEFYYGYHYGNCLDGPTSWFSEKRTRIREMIAKGSLSACRNCNREGIHRSLRYLAKNPLSLIFTRKERNVK